MMPEPIKIGLKSITAIIAILSFLFGSLWSVAKVSYNAGSQSDTTRTEIKRVESKTKLNCTKILGIETSLQKEIKRSREIDAQQKDVLHRLDKNIAIQSVVLNKLEKKLE